MDIDTPDATPHGPCSTASHCEGQRCARRTDGLTLATVVIALAGFVGTAAFAAPIDCNAQPAPSAATAR
jgi:hypothetical protein